VKFVKGNFLPGRAFHDDGDLAEQCQQWLEKVNTERENDATGQLPATRLSEEQCKFAPIPSCACDYGFFDCVVVSREALVALEGNRYSVPAHLVGRTLTLRLHQDRIELFSDDKPVASHKRSRGHNERIINPAHFEAVFERKPRGRVMVYRDWLCSLSPISTQYVRELCYKRRAALAQQMILLYETAQKWERCDFLAALELAAEQDMYGAEYVAAILTSAKLPAPQKQATCHPASSLLVVPGQHEVERDLALYEEYVANREQVHLGAGGCS